MTLGRQAERKTHDMNVSMINHLMSWLHINTYLLRGQLIITMYSLLKTELCRYLSALYVVAL